MEDQIEEAELKLYTQLYEDSKPKGNEGLDRLKEKLKIYDINPNLNYKIMKKILDKKNLNDEDIDDFCNFYRDYIQTLFIEQKLDIIRKIKDKKNEKIKNKILFKLNEKSFIDSYFDIIKELCTICSKLSLHKKVDYQKLLNLFMVIPHQSLFKIREIFPGNNDFFVILKQSHISSAKPRLYRLNFHKI